MIIDDDLMSRLYEFMGINKVRVTQLPLCSIIDNVVACHAPRSIVFLEHAESSAVGVHHLAASGLLESQGLK